MHIEDGIQNKEEQKRSSKQVMDIERQMKEHCVLHEIEMIEKEEEYKALKEISVV